MASKGRNFKTSEGRQSHNIYNLRRHQSTSRTSPSSVPLTLEDQVDSYLTQPTEEISRGQSDTHRSQTANQFTFDPPQWLLLIMGILVLIACLLLVIWILTKISVSVVTIPTIIITIQNNTLYVII